MPARDGEEKREKGEKERVYKIMHWTDILDRNIDLLQKFLTEHKSTVYHEVNCCIWHNPFSAFIKWKRQELINNKNAKKSIFSFTYKHHKKYVKGYFFGSINQSPPFVTSHLVLYILASSSYFYSLKKIKSFVRLNTDNSAILLSMGR